MKNIFFVLLLIAGLAACSTDSTQGDTEIAKLEQTAGKNPNPDTSKMLIEKYFTYISNNPNDDEMNSRYLYRAAELQYRMKLYPSATRSLTQALKNHYKSSNTANNALFLASIYKEKMRNNAGAAAIYQCFIETFPTHEKIAEIKKDYGSEVSLDEKLVDYGNRLMNDSTNRIDYKVANQFINVCEIHALMMPQSQKSAEYLHKAGETARSLRSFQKALSLYDMITQNYPNSEKAPQALFLKAFTLDNDLKKYDEARKLYEKFLAKYPDDDFADDTKFLLENLGKDDEEIIQSFGQKEG